MYDEYDSSMTLVAAVLVVGLLVGAGVGYYIAPVDYNTETTSTPEPTPVPLNFDWFYYVPYVGMSIVSAWVWTISDRVGKLKRRLRNLERSR